MIEQLLGRKFRIVYPGDCITKEYQPGRVTIYITEGHFINNIVLFNFINAVIFIEHF